MKSNNVIPPFEIFLRDVYSWYYIFIKNKYQKNTAVFKSFNLRVHRNNNFRNCFYWGLKFIIHSSEVLEMFNSFQSTHTNDQTYLHFD